MIRGFLCVMAVMVSLAGCICVHETETIRERPIAASTHATGRQPAQLLHHVVLMKFKEGTSAEQIRKIESAFCALPGKISAIYDLEWGTDVSVENLQQGFTHCFVVIFCNEAGRAEYLPHPAHQDLTELASPYIDKILVVDYWAK